ncbi:hypothetical protein V3851_12325 [Paenibacillus sp. M1]|uniref:Uncharacterized protein n=1 Tax=Paenibacillus haidiansis TaxID=1574488 RepID=A0ABU7VUM3_9BACL
MEYLNVSLESFDDAIEVYFYGEIIPIHDTLINFPLSNDYNILYFSTFQAMKKFLLKQAEDQIHINLFVNHIDLMTFGAIHGFLKTASGIKENHHSSKRRLMVWVINQEKKDCRAFGYYEG